MQKNLNLLALAILPTLSAAHYLFPHFILNDNIINEFEYVREHDNGFMPSWDDGAVLSSNDLRCNEGSENHLLEPRRPRSWPARTRSAFRSISRPRSTTQAPSP